MEQSISATRFPAGAAGIRPLVLLVLVLALLVTLFSGRAATAAGQDDHGDDSEGSIVGESSEEPTEAELAAAEARDEQLREGAQAYSQICASCHQAGGIGVVGQYPPLAGNDHIDDPDEAEYIRAVITTGRAGPIEVLGETYDGVMPSFSTVSDADAEAIIAYIQNGFVAPPRAGAALPSGPVAGTELPALANMSARLAYMVAAGAALLVLGPRITSIVDRLNVAWLDAWLKTAVIVAAVVLLTVYVPDWAVRNSAVTSLSRFAQEAIGVSLWLAGLAAVLWGLWYAHRESRL